MSEEAQREMTLAEWVGRLYEGHRARREYDELVSRAGVPAEDAAVESGSVTDKDVQDLIARIGKEMDRKRFMYLAQLPVSSALGLAPSKMWHLFTRGTDGGTVMLGVGATVEIAIDNAIEKSGWKPT